MIQNTRNVYFFMQTYHYVSSDARGESFERFFKINRTSEWLVLSSREFALQARQRLRIENCEQDPHSKEQSHVEYNSD